MSARGRASWWVAAAVVCAAAAGAVLFSRGTGGTGGADLAAPSPPTTALEDRVGGVCDPPEPRPEVVTEEDAQRFEAGVRETERVVAETGWMYAQGRSMVESGVWYCGWVRPPFVSVPGDPLPPAELPLAPNTMYVRPGGEVLGYGYGVAGLLPADRVGEVDVEAAIIDATGCLSIYRSVCTEQADQSPEPLPPGWEDRDPTG